MMIKYITFKMQNARKLKNKMQTAEDADLVEVRLPLQTDCSLKKPWLSFSQHEMVMKSGRDEREWRQPEVQKDTRSKMLEEACDVVSKEWGFLFNFTAIGKVLRKTLRHAVACEAVSILKMKQNHQFT